MIEANRDTIILALERVFELRPVQAEKLFAEVLQCVRKKDLVSILKPWWKDQYDFYFILCVV